MGRYSEKYSWLLSVFPRWFQRRPFYNIVVSDSRNRRDGRFIERLGFYNPVGKEGAENFRVASDRLTHWFGKGAQCPTPWPVWSGWRQSCPAAALTDRYTGGAIAAALRPVMR